MSTRFGRFFSPVALSELLTATFLSWLQIVKRGERKGFVLFCLISLLF